MRSLLNLNLTKLSAFAVLLTVFVMINGRISVGEAKKKTRPPLIEETARRHYNSPTHCVFGNHTYEIGERWRPHLEPFGVYYCISCECVAVQRKSRIAAKVRCKNIKNDCPTPTCDNPVLLPERCCKTCVGEAAFPDDGLNASVSNNQMQKSFFSDATNNFIGEPSHKCYYEGEIYEDGAQWKARPDCEMCSCQRGRVKCEQEICPKLNCDSPVTVAGACCAVCPNQVGANSNATSMTEGCYFEGDKKFHIAGARWHPYLPPFGFDKCSLCTCLSDTLEIKCERNIECPRLTCPEHEAYRENYMDCCKRCPNQLVKSMVPTDQMGDQRTSNDNIKSPNELLAGGGCKFKGRVFPNGESWHPTVQPFGEVKCVKCRCKDGIHKCKRIICPKITACSIVINKSNECCPICADDTEDGMLKSQPIVSNTHRKRGRNNRKKKG